MISAILLAAGMSKRMMGENKLAKKFKDIALINHSVNNILYSNVDKIIIVLGFQKEIIEKIISKNEKISFVFNKHFESGIASSIKIGLDHLPKNTDNFFICLGDMPNVNKDIYNKLIKSKHNNEVVIPTFKGKLGNPILFSKSVKDILMNVKDDMGAKKIIDKKKQKVLELEIGDQSVIQNFNTKESFVL